MKYTILQSTEDDKECTYQLNSKCYRDAVISQFGIWDEGFQRATFENKWSKLQYNIIQPNETNIGVYSITQEDRKLILSEILIDPEHQNRGHGTVIIHREIHEAQNKELDLRLQVLIKL